MSSFIGQLINEAVLNCTLEANYILAPEYKNLDKKYKETLGLTPDPDDEPEKVKAKRYDFGYFEVQPPYSYHKLNDEERHNLYKATRKTLETVLDGVKAISSAGLGFVFTGHPDGDNSKTCIRLVADKDDKYAAMYQQEDDNKNGVWDQGDFIMNVYAKNDNVHTFVHECGHKFYYECMTNDQAKEWNNFFKVRKFDENKQQFLSKYSKENDREDFAEAFAVYVLGDDKINDLYDDRRINKNPKTVQMIIGKFKNIAISPILKQQEQTKKELEKQNKQRMKPLGRKR